MAVKVLNTLIFDRSNPDEIVCVAPKGHKDWPEGRSFTRAEDLELGFARADLAMVNFENARGEVHKQVCVYADKGGKILWNGMRKHFTSTEQAEIRAIAKRIVAVAETYPQFKKLLQGY